MARVGSLTGTAVLTIDNDELGTIEFDIGINERRPGGLKSGRGHLSGDPAILQKAFFTDKKVRLRLDDGSGFVVVVTQWDAGSSEVSVVTSGQIPMKG